MLKSVEAAAYSLPIRLTEHSSLGGVVRLTNHELADYDRSRLSCCELTPFCECSSAVLLEDVAAVEVTVLVEVIVD
jgi:hypothetical protein